MANGRQPVLTGVIQSDEKDPKKRKSMKRKSSRHGNRLYLRVPGVSGLKKDEHVFVVITRPETVKLNRKRQPV